MVNVSDQSVALTSSVRLTDMYGQEVSVTSGGPFSVPPGESHVIAPSCPAPAEEGAYGLQLTLWDRGAVVADARHAVQVVAVQIGEFDGPQQIALGEPAAFTVTLANFSASALSAELGLDIATEAGSPVVSLPAQTAMVPAGAQATVSFAWDGVAPAGLYQVVASVRPASYPSRSQARLLTVKAGQNTYLPAILKH